MRDILRAELWGDSIGRGVVYDEQRQRYAVGRPSYADILRDKGLVDIQNHARFGATVVEGLADFLQAGSLAGNSVLIQYGGNDCNFNWEQIAESPRGVHSPKVPLELFEDTLHQFVKAVRAVGKQPILVTLPPLHAESFFYWVTQGIDADNVLKFLGDASHVYRWQERYSLAVLRVAKAAGVKVFDVRDAFLAADDFRALMCPDGMHPNLAGHALTAAAAERALPSLLWQADEAPS